MSHTRTLLLFLCASLAFPQGADSILLLNQQIVQVARDPQGNLLVAQRNGTTVSVSRYSPQGQLMQSFTGVGQTLNTGGPVALASDSQGVIYMAGYQAGGPSLVRLTAAWNPSFPPTPFLFDAIGFDPQNNPILLTTTTGDPAHPHGRVLKLDRVTGQMLASADLGPVYFLRAMTVDSSGSVYVTGMADTLKGFALKLDPTLQNQVYFTSLDAAMPNGIAADSNGYAYIAETPFLVPVTVGPPGGGLIAFGANAVYKLDSSGNIVTSNKGGGWAIALDGSGNVIVTGGSYPATGAFQTPCGPRTDLAGLSITVLDPLQLQPQSSALLAQQNFQSASALLPDGSLYVATQANCVLHANPAAPSSPVACIANGASYLVESSIVPGQLLTIFGRGLGSDPISIYDDSEQLPFSSNGTTVQIGGYPAPLLAVSSTQINAIVPYEVNAPPSQPVSVEISRNGSVIYTWQMNLAVRNPTPLLRFTSSGALDIFQAPVYQDLVRTYPVPLAAVLNQDGTPNTAANPAHLGSMVTIFATGFGHLGGTAVAAGAPGGTMPAWPANILPDFPFPALADIPVWTPSGNLALPLPTPITTIEGHSNALLQIQATIPAYFPPGPLPFFIGPWNADSTPVWTNFFYVAQ